MIAATGQNLPLFYRTVCTLTAALLLVSLGGCAQMLTPHDPRPAEVIVSDAERLVIRKAYASAADLYAIAITKDRANAKYYLRYAELLERTEQDKRARKAYLLALKRIPEDDPKRLEIMYRLALIEVHHLMLLDHAEELQQQMPASSIERLDLAGYFYYLAGQHQLAINILSKALERVKNNEQQAQLLYHAALVYRELGDEKNTFGSLYHAINLAQHLGLIREIEALWEELNSPGTPSSTTPAG